MLQLLHFSGATSPLIFTLAMSCDLDLVAEICWIFTFLTAKDDASVENLLKQELIKVEILLYIHQQS